MESNLFPLFFTTLSIYTLWGWSWVLDRSTFGYDNIAFGNIVLLSGNLAVLFFFYLTEEKTNIGIFQFMIITAPVYLIVRLFYEFVFVKQLVKDLHSPLVLIIGLISILLINGILELFGASRLKGLQYPYELFNTDGRLLISVCLLSLVTILLSIYVNTRYGKILGMQNQNFIFVQNLGIDTKITDFLSLSIQSISISSALGITFLLTNFDPLLGLQITMIALLVGIAARRSFKGVLFIGFLVSLSQIGFIQAEELIPNYWLNTALLIIPLSLICLNQIKGLFTSSS